MRGWDVGYRGGIVLLRRSSKVNVFDLETRSCFLSLWIGIQEAIINVRILGSSVHSDKVTSKCPTGKRRTGW